MDTTVWRPLVAVAATTVLIGLAACSDDNDGALDAAPSSATAEEDGSASAGGNGSDEAREGGAGAGAGGGSGRGETLGTTTGQHPADPLNAQLVPLRLDVTGLERNGELVELYLTLTNEGDANGPAFEPYSTFGSDTQAGGSFDLAGISLVDQAGQKLYLPAIDSESVCLCTEFGSMSIPPGQSVDLEATFGGVPEDVESLDLHAAGFDPVTGLEVAG